MSVRVRYKISAVVSSTSAEEKDLGNQTWEVVTDTQGEGGSWKTTVLPGETNVRLNLGNLAIARLLIVRTTAKDPTQNPTPILVRKESTSGETVVVQPVGDAKEGHLLLATDSVTAIYVSNPDSGVPMDLAVIACGD